MCSDCSFKESFICPTVQFPKVLDNWTKENAILMLFLLRPSLKKHSEKIYLPLGDINHYPKEILSTDL